MLCLLLVCKILFVVGVLSAMTNKNHAAKHKFSKKLPNNDPTVIGRAIIDTNPPSGLTLNTEDNTDKEIAGTDQKCIGLVKHFDTDTNSGYHFSEKSANCIFFDFGTSSKTGHPNEHVHLYKLEDECIRNCMPGHGFDPQVKSKVDSELEKCKLEKKLTEEECKAEIDKESQLQLRASAAGSDPETVVYYYVKFFTSGEGPRVVNEEILVSAETDRKLKACGVDSKFYIHFKACVKEVVDENLEQTNLKFYLLLKEELSVLEQCQKLPFEKRESCTRLLFLLQNFMQPLQDLETATVQFDKKPETFEEFPRDVKQVIDVLVTTDLKLKDCSKSSANYKEFKVCVSEIAKENIVTNNELSEMLKYGLNRLDKCHKMLNRIRKRNCVYDFQGIRLQGFPELPTDNSPTTPPPESATYKFPIKENKEERVRTSHELIVYERTIDQLVNCRLNAIGWKSYLECIEKIDEFKTNTELKKIFIRLEVNLLKKCEVLNGLERNKCFGSSVRYFPKLRFHPTYVPTTPKPIKKACQDKGEPCSSREQCCPKGSSKMRCRSSYRPYWERYKGECVEPADLKTLEFEDVDVCLKMGESCKQPWYHFKGSQLCCGKLQCAWGRNDPCLEFENPADVGLNGKVACKTYTTGYFCFGRYDKKIPLCSNGYCNNQRK